MMSSQKVETTVGPRYNSNRYKGYPDITVNLSSPNCIIFSQFNLFIKLTLILETDFQVPMGLLYRGPTVFLILFDLYSPNSRMMACK